MATSGVRRRTASDQVSAALLSAAETVLDRDGIDAVTIRSVAQQAEVSPTSVYNRFGAKDGLIAALATRTLDQLAEAIVVPADLEPAERFRRACRNYRQFALDHPARYSLIFAVGSPLADQAAAVARHGRTVFEILVGLVAALNDVAAEEDCLEAAQAVWSAVHGAVTIEHAGIGQTPAAGASYDYLLDLLVNGLAAGIGS